MTMYSLVPCTMTMYSLARYAVGHSWLSLTNSVPNQKTLLFHIFQNLKVFISHSIILTMVLWPRYYRWLQWANIWKNIKPLIADSVNKHCNKQPKSCCGGSPASIMWVSSWNCREHLSGHVMELGVIIILPQNLPKVKQNFRLHSNVILCWPMDRSFWGYEFW